ncbi:MAG TPA: nickel-dependent lactate racemase [Spirochaetia bacterium]|nr:nickel-dependent lactate racemase [Spirochaetia bacterium]
MIVELAYGSGRLPVELPDGTTVISPQEVDGLPDEHTAFSEAVRGPIGGRPLKEIAGPHDTVAIVIADITRPCPSERLVPWILQELAHVPREHFVIVNGTGSHRPNTREELISMLGIEVVDTIRIVNHNAFDKSTLTRVGRTSYGADVWLNNEYLDATVKIVTGFIEPHFFAGFSGGPKGIVPGVAGIDTIMHLHNARMIGDPASTWGSLTPNPVQAEAREGVAFAPPDFLVNVSINSKRQITGVFAGNYLTAHEAGCRFVARHATRPVDGKFDIVVTTNSGYPLDQNLYQTVKGMSAASRIVKENGAIVVASECREGFPSHGNFRAILQMRENPTDLLRMIEDPSFSMFDQWEAQTQAIVARHARIYLYSSMPDDEVRQAMLEPIASVPETIRSLVAGIGETARVAALPEGPQTIPYVADPVLPGRP